MFTVLLRRVAFHFMVFTMHWWNMDAKKLCGSFTKFGWKPSNASGATCFTYHGKMASWWDAQKFCEEEGQSLVKVTNETINDFIRQNLFHEPRNKAWIDGIHRKNDRWRIAGGETMKYTNFQTTSPTWDQFSNFFRSKDLCAMAGYHTWYKKDCGTLERFVCVTDLDKIMTKTGDLEVTTVAVRDKITTKTGDLQVTTATALTTPKQTEELKEAQKWGVYKAKRVVRGRLNPKLLLKGTTVTTAPSIPGCVRLCSYRSDCELVNFCEETKSCSLYENQDIALNGGVTSEVGCSVYVDKEKSHRE